MRQLGKSPSEPFCGQPGGLLAYGDPHGDFRPLLAAHAKYRPSAVVILGDFGLKAPLRETLAPIFAAGTEVAYIPGNHEGDSEAAHDSLLVEEERLNLAGRCRNLAGFAVGGLGGVFRGSVWFPKAPGTPPKHTTRASFVEQHPNLSWRDGCPLRHRVSIFPEDVAAVARHRLDILVCHEAPRTHPFGFAAIDELAHATGARMVIYGHHHEAASCTMAGGISVRGLGRAQPWLVRLGAAEARPSALAA